jgi:glycosyltransferase involved in cell wall biosynthesis
MRELFFDLSELFLGAERKYRYYGIARTVSEVGFELHRRDVGVRFVVHSPTHRRFFEVFPRIGGDSADGLVDPGLPAAARPVRWRRNIADRSAAFALVHRAVAAVVDRIGAARWRAVPAKAAREVDLGGALLVSLGRPKMLADSVLDLPLGPSGVVFVPLLHDLIPLHDRRRRLSRADDRYAFDNARVVEAASMILTNSDFTRREVLAFSQAGVLPPVPAVATVRLAHELRSMGEPLVRRAGAGHLLCVGAETGRKNVECLVAAMLVLRARGVALPSVVFAGARRRRLEKYFARGAPVALRSRVAFVHDPDQTALRRLYEEALALVLPSRMEGWGLPAGEALWCGVPALLADIPALHEVGGDLASYFDPDDPAALADLIERLLLLPEARAETAARIAAAAPTLRRWRDVAADLLEAVAPLR